MAFIFQPPSCRLRPFLLQRIERSSSLLHQIVGRLGPGRAGSICGRSLQATIENGRIRPNPIRTLRPVTPEVPRPGEQPLLIAGRPSPFRPHRAGDFDYTNYPSDIVFRCFPQGMPSCFRSQIFASETEGEAGREPSEPMMRWQGMTGQ